MRAPSQSSRSISATPVGGHLSGRPPRGNVWGPFISDHPVAVLIDGGHVRALARAAKKKYDNDYVEKVALACIEADEELLRVLYYDCARFAGKVKLPISGGSYEF